MDMATVVDLMRSRGVSQADMADAIGVSQASVSRWVAGTVTPKRYHVQAMAQALGVPEDYLLPSVEYSAILVPDGGAKAHMPLLGRVHAGDGSEPDVLKKKVPVPYEVAQRHKRAFLLEVEGDCMDKVLPPGCLVMVDPLMEPMNRSVAVVSLDGSDYMVRRVTRGADTLMLSPESHNPEWRDLIVRHGEGPTVALVGTVVWYQPKEELG